MLKCLNGLNATMFLLMNTPEIFFIDQFNIESCLISVHILNIGYYMHNYQGNASFYIGQ